MNGWNADVDSYLNNMKKAANLVQSELFRPPYGRIRLLQARAISKKYKIIMWDVLSGDFDPSNSVEDCYKNVIDNAVPGSIIVFHDSIKSRSNVLGTLPLVLNYFSSLGYRFETLKADLFVDSDKNLIQQDSHVIDSALM